MNVCVLGLWHLGTVTAACLAAAGHRVTGVDFDPAVVDRLRVGKAPLFEPNLDDLIAAGQAAGTLRFSSDAAAASNAEVVWVTYDTPVDEADNADAEFVVERTAMVYPYLLDGSLVLVSSQLPVGTTRRIEQQFAASFPDRSVDFAYSPENLRLGKAIAAFSQPDRIVVGVRAPRARQSASALLAPITDRIEWMSVESAEMTKHALNAFLATSVTFINEISAVCERVGADAAEVERGLKSEARIGPRAYLSPGGAFAGGTLARDIVFLTSLGREHQLPMHVISAVKASNDDHRQWANRRLEELLGGVAGQRIAVWGLTYKPGTDTLRRSSALELCRQLSDRGAAVEVHDPAVRALPPDLPHGIHLADDAVAAVRGASALVVATPWPEYRAIAAEDVASEMAQPLVLDANRFLADTLGAHAQIRYVSVGRVRP
jgi:UDPglucose 6-dehydrogenase